jgi:transcriptional regulator with XRE-family HTH domain
MTKNMARKLDVSGKTAKLHVKRKIVPSKRARKNSNEEPPTIVVDRKGTNLKIEASIGERIRQSRETQKISQDTLAKNITRILQHNGMSDMERSRSAVAQWENGNAFPEFSTISAIAKALNKPPEYIAYGITDEPKVVAPDPEQLGYALVPEITVTDVDEFEEKQKWGLPLAFLRGLGITMFREVALFKVEVNGEPFEYGDYVVIDRSNVKPSPPGHFLYWDGFGANIAKMHVVLGNQKKPVVKVQGPTGTYEFDVGKVSIIGRVKGVWKKA